jgi:murein DD-endopeptidase MepM/ murein hydrolase activator NlpD
MRDHRRAGAWAVVALVALSAPAPARAASADVAALQLALNASGIAAGPIDGITGPQTRTAVVRFQRRHHLAADGVAGPRTRAALGRRGRPPLGSRAMTPGVTGWDVAALQFLLQSRGFGPGAIDGGFGPATSNAVVGFQAAVGLGADGIAGPLTLHALKSEQVGSAAGVGFARPVAGAWTDGFGWVGGRRHTGLDFPEPTGTPVHAAGAGTISYAGPNDGGYGNLVVITHGHGLETWYAHLSTIALGAGAQVVAGTVVGTVGATGRATGPHLHFEVREYGTPVDPAPRLAAAFALRSSRAGRRAPGCAPNADARHTHDTDPPFARLDRCP